MTDDALLALWGKTVDDDPEGYHPLLFHMLDVGAVAEALVPCFGAPEPLPSAWMAYLAALHDIGKADPLFQAKCPGLARRLRPYGLDWPDTPVAFRHEARTAAWVADHLRSAHGWGRQAACGVAAPALHGHHGDFHSPLSEDENPRRFERWEAARTALAARVSALLEPPPLSLSSFPDASTAGVRLTGMIVLADWIASNEDVYPYPALARPGGGEGLARPADYLAAARLQALRTVRLLRFLPEAHGPESVPARFTDVWPRCLEPRPTQRALEELLLAAPPAPGLAIIEAPMGEGKTEAALYLAEHWRRAIGREGAYLALPTAATSNQMHGRYARFLARYHPQSDAPRLVHGMAWLLDDFTPEETAEEHDASADPTERARAREWFRPGRRALLAPDGVGTVDQALLAALHVKHGVLRLLGLSSKVLIIDEVHAYDAYMSTILERLLRWCAALGTPVILLSATLSNAQKVQLTQAYAGAGATAPDQDTDPAMADYPLLSFASPSGGARRIPVPRDAARDREVRLIGHPGLLDDHAGIALLAADSVRDGGCACILVNTVAAAQAVFRHLQSLPLAGVALSLFHARFRAERRQELERAAVDAFGSDAGQDGKIERPCRAILVATQVVEQSLDVDFDVMISQLAPVDLLLQRCGRLHRHARGARPTGPEAVLHVLLPAPGKPDFGATGMVYHPAVLLRTLALLHDRKAFSLPHDFRPLVEGCYGATALPPNVIDPLALEDAARQRAAMLADEEQQARVHLIPEPNPRTFQLGQKPEHPVEEDEEGRAGYLHARTRLGSRTRSLLAIHDPDLLAAARSPRPPRRDVLRHLFLQKVDVPAWWLAGLIDHTGAPVDLSGPLWLRDCLILPLSAGAWNGRRRDREGRDFAVVLRDDPQLGLVYLTEGRQDGDL